MNTPTKTAVRPAGTGPSIAATLACVGLTISLWIGNAALLAALFPNGGRAVALAFLVTTAFLTGIVHGVTLDSRAQVPRPVLYLKATLSWTVVVSIFLLLLGGLTSTPWPALLLALCVLCTIGFVPVVVGIEISRAWLARRWAAAQTDEGHEPASWTDSVAQGGEAC